MKKAAFTATAIALLAGCTLPPEYAGNVVDYNGKTVKIEAVYSPDGQPTQAMQASADKTCGKRSRFLSMSQPHGGVKQVITPTGFAYVTDGSPVQMFYYLFAC